MLLILQVGQDLPLPWVLRNFSPNRYLLAGDWCVKLAPVEGFTLALLVLVRAEAGSFHLDLVRHHVGRVNALHRTVETVVLADRYVALSLRPSTLVVSSESR